MKRIRFDVSLKTVVLAVLSVASVWLFLQLWPILLVIAVSLMIVGSLNPFVARLEARGVRRSYAIAVVFAGLFLAAGLFGAIVVPRLGSRVSELIERLPSAQAQLATRLDATNLGAPIAKSLREARSTELVANVEHLGLSYSSRIVEIVAYSATSLFLALYFMIDRDRMRGTAFALIPRTYHVRASRILLNLETIVGGYLRGQVITSIMMCVFTLAVLGIARVPNALTISLFAGLVDVLPYIGGLLVCGPAFLVALSRGTTVAVVVLVTLAIYQEVESRLIVPRVYGKVLRLPAATVMLSLLIGGKLLGILGALLALPVAAGIRMVVAELRVELPGEDVEDSAVIQRDEAAERDFELRAAGTPAIEAAAIATEIAEERRDEEAAKCGDAVEVPFSAGLSERV
jgi:predicted PurR-regulated permease PerM